MVQEGVHKIRTSSFLEADLQGSWNVFFFFDKAFSSKDVFSSSILLLSQIHGTAL